MTNWKLKAAASLVALAASAPVLAQAAPGVDTAEAAPEDIIVTGFRESIRAALETKRESTMIVDSISAEDIGKFPDRNVAEALQRVPGVVINREFGEGERVSLRGTAPNLTLTQVNGHAIATADWFVLEQLNATRSFNYLTLPADIISQVNVYKSPQADVNEGGIGGTIDVRTRKPLDLAPLTLSASLEGVYSDKSGKFDPQMSATVSWKNEAETIGVLVGGVYQKRRIRRDGIEVLGYMDATTTTGQKVQAPSLIGSALFVQERERYGGNATLQLRPSDTLDINISGLYLRFNANNFNQNYLAWTSQALGGGGTLSNATVVDGTAVSGRVDSVAGGRAVVFDAIDRQALSDTWSADYDMTWRPTDKDTVHLQFGHTKARGDTVNQPFYEGGAPGGFTYDLTGKAPQVSFIGVDPNNPADLPFDFGSLHEITNDDKETYFFFDYERDFSNGWLKSVKVGAKYSSHTRDTAFMATTWGGFFMPLSSQGCDGGPCTSPDFFAGNLTPSNFLKGVAAPGSLQSFWQVDRKKLQDIYYSQPESVRQRVLNPPENFSINEKVMGGYAMANLGGDGQRWRGNVGVRVVITDQTSSGNLLGVTGEGVVTDNPFGVYTPTRTSRSYTDWLPSLNFSFDVRDDLVVRAAAGRTMARPDYTDVVPRVSLNPGTLTGNGGNPLVDPFRADGVDLSLEWYPNKDAIVAVALYYKDIKSYVVNTTVQQVYPIQTATPNPSRCTQIPGDNLYNCLFDVNVRSNGGGGSNKGAEFQVSTPIWAGFGFTGNYTYSDAKSDEGAPIPGNSKHSLNVTGWYENGPFQARLSYNYRSDFFINIDRGSELNQGDTDSLDASISFDINENFAVMADAVNLTNSKITQFSGTTDRPRAIYDNGRQFSFGVRAKF